MKTSQDYSLKEVNFINLQCHVKNLFINNSITLICPIDKLREIDACNFNSFIVHLEDKRVEGNLRMVDSYLPELLFVLSRMNKKGDSIMDIIERSKFENDYLKYKLKHLLEVLLFSDFFHEAFDGKLNYESCYVYKDKELNFFRAPDTQALFNILSYKLKLSVVSHQSDNMKISELRLLLG